MVKKNIAKRLSAVYDFDNISKSDEFVLINKWRNANDKDALEKIVLSHLKLVKKMASGYRGYGVSVDDLMSEGYIGVMQALESFVPEKGFRFSTYAKHCIRSVLQTFVIKTASIVSIKPSNDNKKLFFGGLSRSKKVLDVDTLSNITEDQIATIAGNLDVAKGAVKNVIPRFSKGDFSLNGKDDFDEDSHFEEWTRDENSPDETELLKKIDIDNIKKVLLKAMEGLTNRELSIIKKHRLSDESVSFLDLAREYGISSERIRQIEHTALAKLRKFIVKELKFGDICANLSLK